MARGARKGRRNDEGCVVGRTLRTIILALVAWSCAKTFMYFPSAQILLCAKRSSISNCSSFYSTTFDNETMDIAAFLQRDQGSCLNLDVGAGTKPRLFLHVGPGKMGTTTIQTAIEEDRNTPEFELDNFCPFINNDEFLRFTRRGNGVRFNMTDKELAQGYTLLGAELRKCLNKGFNVALSSEDMGLVSKEDYQTVFEPIFENFDLIVVAGYRRFYDWVPSVFFEIIKERSEEFTQWPVKGVRGEPPLHRWFEKNLDTTLRDLYIENYVKNWMNITMKKITIYNLHEDKDVVKTFYCRILCARSLCKKQSAQPPPKENIGYSTAYDSIAVTAYVEGRITPNSVNRTEAAKHVEKYFNQRKMTTLDLPKICFAESVLERLLGETKRMESTFLPEFYLSEKGQGTMAKEFQKLKETKYCTVDTHEILQEHNFGWEQPVP